MPMYHITVAQTVIEKAFVEIEADTPEQAAELALKAAPEADWKFSEAYGDFEVIECEEIALAN
jgi:hypothetical protein